MNVKEKIKTT